MLTVTQDAVPDEALLRTYRGGTHPERWNAQGDCFAASVDWEVSLAEFVFAFYTSAEFRVERLILALLAGARTTNAQARQLAEGARNSFAVWRVGERTATQLLMCDRYERTRSWFRVVPVSEGKTLLQFGSAVASRSNSQSGSRAGRFLFGHLLRFHVLYSQILLRAAKRGLTKTRAAAGLR